MTETERSECPRCQAAIPAGARFCEMCGLALGGNDAAVQPRPPGGSSHQTNIVDASDRGIVAIGGSTVINAGQVIGRQVNYHGRAPGGRECPDCGEWVYTRGARFCPHCGVRLRGESA